MARMLNKATKLISFPFKKLLCVTQVRDIMTHSVLKQDTPKQITCTHGDTCDNVAPNVAPKQNAIGNTCESNPHQHCH